MSATELALMLGAVAWRLRASADDRAVAPEVLRDIARDGALALEQLRPDVARLRASLARVAAAPVGTWSSLLAAFMQDLAAGQGQGDAASAPAQPHS